MARPGAIALLFTASCLTALASEREAGGPAQADADVTSLLQRVVDVQVAAGSLQRPSVTKGAPQLPVATEPGLLQDQRIIHIPSVKINLDLPPEERWVDFYTVHRDKLLPPPGALGAPPLDTTLQSQINFTVDQELVRELNGILKAVNDARLTMEHLLYRQVGYERGVTAGCTSLLAADANGTVYHGRNLDLSDGANRFSEIFDATYYRGGQPIFAATQLFGSVGVHTGYRIGEYSVAQNTRPGVGNVTMNLMAARNGGRPMMLLIREVLQNVGNFQDAVNRLAEAPLIAPQYFTLAGAKPWEAALISRDRAGNPAPHANVDVLSPQIGRWFLAQTNDDTWKPALDSRRPTMLHGLSGMTAAMVNSSSMLDLMTTRPILSKYTLFTWILVPSTGYRRVFIGLDELLGIEEPSIARR